jgi:four helix bundle protein
MSETGKIQKKDFAKRTMQFGLRVIRLVESLPKSQTAHVIGNQLLRAGTSVGANYRSALRGKSRADFIAKLGIVEEECDEALYWMQMLIEAGIVKNSRLVELMNEADEIIAIVVSSIKTARLRNNSPKSGIRNPK